MSALLASDWWCLRWALLWRRAIFILITNELDAQRLADVQADFTRFLAPNERL